MMERWNSGIMLGARANQVTFRGSSEAEACGHELDNRLRYGPVKFRIWVA
jgi:hypothetical protein